MKIYRLRVQSNQLKKTLKYLFDFGLVLQIDYYILSYPQHKFFIIYFLSRGDAINWTLIPHFSLKSFKLL